MTRSHVFTLLKLLFAAGLIWWVVDSAGLQNIRAALAGIDRAGWVQGMLLILAANCLSMLRWHLLMRSVGLYSTPWTALRLGFIGVFSNNVVPGLTGGDLVKAIYVSRENPSQRTSAVVSVIVDRVIGIVALALIAAVVLPLDIERFGQAAWGIYGFLVAAAAGGVLILSRRAKARLRNLLARLGRKSEAEGKGLLAKADKAVSLYRERIGVMMVALLLSFVVHLLIILSLKTFGDAIARGGLAAVTAAAQEPGLGAERANELAADAMSLTALLSTSVPEYCSIVPIIMIVSSVPIAPGAWGVGETLFAHFFATVSVDKADAVALSFTYRVTVLLVSLLGGVLLVLDRKRVMAAASSAHEVSG